ncbi:MAG: porin family protein [Odoribacteraceae bacterium]|jgi:hypothetical protein|nr:porin family protein [Odoribacteraceae bacterium]
MKKFIFLTLLALAGTSAMAQQKSFELGVHGGWSYNKMYATNYHTRTHWGYAAGLFGRVNFVKGIYLEPAIDYTHKEVVIERSINDTKLRISSLDVPILLGVKFLDFPLAKVRAFAGPIASLLFKPIEYGDNITNMENPPLITSDKTMFYVRAGVGVDIWRATLDISYDLGLKKFGQTISRPQTTNITVGFKIF